MKGVIRKTLMDRRELTKECKELRAKLVKDSGFRVENLLECKGTRNWYQTTSNIIKQSRLLEIAKSFKLLVENPAQN